MLDVQCSSSVMCPCSKNEPHWMCELELPANPFLKMRPWRQLWRLKLTGLVIRRPGSGVKIRSCGHWMPAWALHSSQDGEEIVVVDDDDDVSGQETTPTAPSAITCSFPLRVFPSPSCTLPPFAPAPSSHIVAMRSCRIENARKRKNLRRWSRRARRMRRLERMTPSKSTPFNNCSED